MLAFVAYKPDMVVILKSCMNIGYEKRRRREPELAQVGIPHALGGVAYVG